MAARGMRFVHAMPVRNNLLGTRARAYAPFPPGQALSLACLGTNVQAVITSDKVGGTCFCPCLFVCLSVSKITQNACMDSDEMLHVDRCRDMDELIDF